MCVCNGKITPEYDNYTFIHSRGKPVIDYNAVPFELLNQCLEFKVNVTDVVIDNNDNKFSLNKKQKKQSLLWNPENPVHVTSECWKLLKKKKKAKKKTKKTAVSWQ